ncbi:MAG: PilZ domain-containing protein [Rhodobacter sp.]|nr:PilZ domain-containing protein [Rhodobacter sp.]
MTSERRRFFRIDDEVMLGFELIEQGEVDARLDDFWQNEHAFSIRNNYNFQIEQQIADFNRIEKKMPELARYLSVMQAQIDLITERLVEDERDAALTQRPVNISAQGVSFDDEAAPPESALVELNLKLLPSGLRLVIIARVIKVETQPESEQYRISLDFEYVHEADREILIKHVHGKQMESLSSAQGL